MTTKTRVPVRKRYTVEDYYRMVDSGILREGDRTELIDGEVILMPPISDPHAGNVNRSTALFRATGNREHPTTVVAALRGCFSATTAATEGCDYTIEISTSASYCRSL